MITDFELAIARICVGKYVASSTMWLIIASVIACFDITKSKDEHGNDIEIDDGFEDCGVIKWVAAFMFSSIHRLIRSPPVKKPNLSAAFEFDLKRSSG
ncbi:hypothetical protein CVT25_001186 [Psilocybe cyanescens]|uniref:Uncharacterized protein n=1 Tax=Psilocybe cyanescens TaxID=93625 RepID=A0A409XMH5_PSICY|nr:hypothetical protein CVT25_001186 [Psilocybe cyanescens]